MTQLQILNKFWLKEWGIVKTGFLQFRKSTSNGINSVFTSLNENIIEPKLYPQKSSFQRNKRCSKILSNEEVMANLLKTAPKNQICRKVSTPAIEA